MRPELANSATTFKIPAIRRQFLTIQPAYRDLCIAHSLDSPNAFLSIEGDIISGHSDRHVMRVCIGGVNAILKREHRVPSKDRLASWSHGFGWISVSLREMASIDQLRRHEIPVPDWIAAGESVDGRAFVLLRSLGPCEDLRRYLNRCRRLPDRERRSIARRLAREVARIHRVGFEYPDLYAKHILVDSCGSSFTFVDWQRCRHRRRLAWRNRCRDLAALNASLSDELAGVADRIAFLLAYYRAVGDHSVKLDQVCRRIERRTRRLLRRSSIRQQRLPAFDDSQTLSWLDGEALCVTPLGKSLLDSSSLEQTAYGKSSSRFSRTRIELLNGRIAILVRRSTPRRFSRILEWFRQKRWTSPELSAAADLLRRERLGESPRLLAFGQRTKKRGTVDSFLIVLNGDES